MRPMRSLLLSPSPVLARRHDRPGGTPQMSRLVAKQIPLPSGCPDARFCQPYRSMVGAKQRMQPRDGQAGGSAGQAGEMPCGRQNISLDCSEIDERTREEHKGAAFVETDVRRRFGRMPVGLGQARLGDRLNKFSGAIGRRRISSNALFNGPVVREPGLWRQLPHIHRSCCSMMPSESLPRRASFRQDRPLRR